MKLCEAVLNYEKTRQEAEKEYRVAFRSWKRRMPRPLIFANALLSQNEPDHLTDVTEELIHLVLGLLSHKLAGFTLLLKRLGIESSAALRELKHYTEAMLNEIHEDKWLSGLRYCFLPQFVASQPGRGLLLSHVESDNRRWACLKKSFSEVTKIVHTKGWSPAAKPNEPELCIEVILLQHVRRIEQRVNLISIEPTRPKPKAAHLKGFDGLGQKTTDLSPYYSNVLTQRQRECFSLRFEYAKTITEIAARLGISRATVQEHLNAALRKIETSQKRSKYQRGIKLSQPSPIKWMIDS